MTSLRPSTDGRPFAPDFGARKMERDMEILDMPVRKLPDAWNACVEAALSAKVAVEEEISKARDMQVCPPPLSCAQQLTVLARRTISGEHSIMSRSSPNSYHACKTKV